MRRVRCPPPPRRTEAPGCPARPPGVTRLVDSGGPLAKPDKRFKNFGLKDRGIPIV